MSDVPETPWAQYAAKVAAEGWPALPPKVNVCVNLFTYDGTTHADAAVYVQQITSQAIVDMRGSLSQFAFGYRVGYPTTAQRNLAVMEAKSRGFHFLLMLDNDMAFDARMGHDENAVEFFPAALKFAMSQPAPVFVGAPYCSGPPLQEVQVFKNREVVPDMPGAQGKKLDKYTRDEAAVQRGIKRVAALPTGCLLMDLRAFDMLPPVWFRYEYEDPIYETKVISTEDVVNTRDMGMVGVSQYCAWDSWAHHHKRMEVGKPPEFPAENLSRSVWDAWRAGAKPTLSN